MKKINFLLAAMLGVAALTMTSCDECKDVVCENGGTCTDGVCECADMYYGDACETHCMNGTYGSGACTCDAGYEGDACDTESRDKMTGSYAVDDACSASGAASYTCEISEASTAADAILISNFWAVFAANVTATVDGDQITIANQEPDGDGYTVSGSGTYSDGAIDFEYSITAPDGAVDNCDATWTKQ